MFSLGYLFKTLGQLQLISIQFSSSFFFYYKRTIQTSHCFDTEQYQKSDNKGNNSKLKVTKILAS